MDTPMARPTVAPPFLRSRFLAATLCWSLAAVVWIGAALVPRGDAAAGVFNPETFTLDNGMQVVVVPNHRVPVVTHMVWYRVGAMDEPPGKSGVAHYLEHLMFKGTETPAPGEFSRLVSQSGGRENAFTSQDYTGYFQTVAKEHLATVMELEADRMTNLVLTAEVIEPERQVILEERRQRVDNRPAGLLGEHVSSALFLNHPYRIPVIGWEHEIRALTMDDIVGFYRRFYAPNNAILVVAGDVTAAEVRPLAERFYGPIPAAASPVRAEADEPPQHAARRVVLRDARVGQPAWGRHYLAPGHLSEDSHHAEALDVLAEVLGGGTTSRLYRSLVVDQALAVSAGAYYDPSSRGPARFGIYASPRPGVGMDALEDAVDAELKRILADGIVATELERVKARVRANAIYVRDSLSTGARALGAALAVGRTVDDVESWPERMAAVTAEDVAAAAAAVLREERSVTALLLRPDDPTADRAGTP